jgi:protein SCO1
MSFRFAAAAVACCVAIGVAHAQPAGATKAAHAPPAAAAQFTVQTRAGVQPPDIALTSMTRRPSSLRKELDSAEPVVVNFVFTTCSTICSTQTATLAALQRQLRANGKAARFLTFTIDPDNDTPEQLAKFARQFEIAAGWDFFTGKFDDLVRQQQAFDVYRGAKASHPPVVLMRRARASPWVRVEGHPSPNDLRAVFEQLPAS